MRGEAVSAAVGIGDGERDALGGRAAHGAALEGGAEREVPFQDGGAGHYARHRRRHAERGLDAIRSSFARPSASEGSSGAMRGMGISDPRL